MPPVIRDDVRALTPYHVPVATGIKLDAMENPFELPPAVREKLLFALAQVPLNRYPVPSYRALKKTLIDCEGLPPDADLVLGNGSDELISLLCLACARPQAKVLLVEPSFVMYRISAQLAGMEVISVPLSAQFELDLPALLATIAREQPALLFLAYPNNPTGNLFARADIEILISAMHGCGLVVIDEAYGPYANSSFVDRLAQTDNVVLLRTLSKLGLAGLRLGYLLGAFSQEIEKIRPPYNINRLTEAAVLALLPEHALWQTQIQAILAERTRLLAHLNQFSAQGVETYPSAANFVLLRIKARGAVDFADYCQQHGLLIKNLGKMPQLASCVRVSVGTAAENTRFLQLLEQYLNP